MVMNGRIHPHITLANGDKAFGAISSRRPLSLLLPLSLWASSTIRST